MDAAALGGVIGLSVMICMMAAHTCYEKREKWKQYFKGFRRPFSRKMEQNCLLPVVSKNPLVVRRESKKFQMKDLL